MEKLKLIKSWKTLLLLICMSLFSGTIFAQGITLRGKVVDDKGEALIGAKVAVTTAPATAASTNISGDFTLKVPADTKSITISYIGYKSVDMPIKSNSGNLGEIPLAVDANSLSEVVVVGYGTQQKRDVTGSTVSVDAASLQEVPSAGVVNQLEGKVAGLDVVNGTMKIRGNRTIGASITGGADAPLLVVDGIPYPAGTNINDIDPQNIKNVEILKDASATAIYGSRGSGGVILVTTNRGRVGRSITTLNAFYGIDDMAQNFKVLNAAQYLQLKNDAVVGQLLQATTTATTNSYVLSPLEQAGQAAGTNTNWQNLLYQPAYQADQTLGVSGGDENTTYNISAGYRVSTAVEPNNRNERYTLQAQLDHSVSKSIRIGVNMSNTLTYTDANGGNNQTNAIQISPLLSPFNPNGSLDVTPWAGLTDSSYPNPLYQKYNPAASYNNTRNFHDFTNLYAEWTIFKDLKYKLTAGYDQQQQQQAQYAGINGTSILNQANSTASINDGFNYTYTLDNLLTYDHTFAQKHHVTFVALFSNEKHHNDGVIAGAKNIPGDVNQAYYLSGSTETSISSSESENGLVSEMARLNYSYDGRYALTATVRNDASSELSTGHQYLAYPALGAAWNVSNEKWMQQYSWIDNLKVRFGYGVTSNGPLNGNAYQTLGGLTGAYYEYGSVATGDAAGLLVNSLVNTGLTWQKTGEYNLGIDFGVLKDRLTGSIELYSDKTTGIILGNQLPPTVGGGPNQPTNLGTSANKGLEISLTSINIQNKGGFSWTTDFNIAFSRERIVSLPNGNQFNIGNGEFDGWPLNVVYDNRQIGIWQLANATQTTNSSGYLVSTPVTSQSSPKEYPGMIRDLDVNGDGVINNADNQIIGTFQPQYTGGITNRFSYKGVDVSIVIAARMGQIAAVPYLSSGGSTGGWAFLGTSRHNQPYENYWTPTNPGGTFAEPNSAAQTIPLASSEQYFNDSWIKARSINLGYTIPSRYLSRVGISSLRVYLNCSNPFVIYAPIRKVSDGIDPEGGNTAAVPSLNGGFNGNILSQPAQGLNIGEYTRNWLLGINLKF